MELRFAGPPGSLHFAGVVETCADGSPVRDGFPDAPPRPPAQPSPRRESAPGGRARAAVHELALGRALLVVRDAELHLALGYLRFGAYVAERLGVSPRTAQELMRMASALKELPAVASAFERGEITSAHVRLLTRVATPSDERLWVARARRRSARLLARDIALAREETEGVPGESEARGRAGTALAVRMIDPGPVSQRLTFRSAAWIASAWRDVKVRVRRLAGSPLPDGACLEALLAESSQGGWQPPESGKDGGLHASAHAQPGEDRTGECCASNLSGDSMASNEPAGRRRPGTIAGGEPPAEAEPKARASSADSTTRARSSPAEAALFAREMDRKLRRLLVEGQRHEAAMADEVARCRRNRSHLLAGYESLEAFALERYGLSPRRLYYLLALHRDLDRLAGLRLAFLAGRVTLRQALLVAKVSTPRTVEAWIRRAESVTFRRLEDEVDFWIHLRDTRQEVWSVLKGRPLPEGIVLEPGMRPRLHASAFRDASPGPVDALDALSEGGLHASARRDAGHGAADGPATLRSASGFVEFVTARTLLSALEADEALTPLPGHMCVISMLVEPEVMEMWKAKVAELRETIRQDLQEWEVLALLIHHFVTTWDTPQTRRQVRENPILERGGWRCAVPGCRSVGTGNLHVHHVEWRSRGGAVGDAGNEIPVCSGHHLILIHGGIVRVSGRAPDDLMWGLGLVPGHPEIAAFQVFEGDKLIRGPGW